MRALVFRSFVVAAAAGGAIAVALVSACASDDPSDLASIDASVPPMLGDAGPGEGEAGVPEGNVCGNAGGLETGAAWPLLGGCPKRAGAAGTPGPRTATVTWSVPLAAGDTSPAVAADGSVWVGTSEGDVVVLSDRGVVRGAWRTGGAIRSSAARAATGVTILGSTDGSLYAVTPALEPVDAGSEAGLDAGDAADASDVDADAAVPDASAPPAHVVWSRAVGPIVSSPVIGSDGTIYVTTTSGRLVAVAADGSSTRWSFTTNDTLGSSPCVAADGTLYVGSSDHKLYAVTPAGLPRWSRDLGAPVVGSPVVGGDETVYVGGSDGLVHALTAAGETRWTYRAGGSIGGSPAVRGAVLYVGSDDQKLHAVATTTGAPIWTYATLGAVATPILGADGTVYVGSADGNLYAVAPSGLLFFAVKAKGKIHGAPALGGDGTLFVTTENAVLAIGP